MGTKTPWGTADSSERVAPGLYRYTTPSHGGYHLSKKLNAKVHEAWRKKNGWYEEDVAWAFVALTFPEYFSKENVEYAHASAKSHYPEEYTAVTGNPVAVHESWELRRREAVESCTKAGKLVTKTCFGDWHKKVPADHVAVVAVTPSDYLRYWSGKGGNPPEKVFLVPAEDYNNPEFRVPILGFVLDPGKYKEVSLA